MAKGSQIRGWTARCVLALLFVISAFAEELQPFRADRLIVVPKSGREQDLKRHQQRKRHRLKKRFDALGGIQVVQLEAGENLAETAREYEASGLVEFAEPDYILRASVIPNDPEFSRLWSLQAGTDYDTDAVEGWDRIPANAQAVTVAVIDSGVRYTHEDLAANIWVNARELRNGLDDDRNGYVDDIHGIDAVNGTGNPVDENGHGTHVAGTIGAVANNGKGVAGVCWNTKIMALKFMDSSGEGDTSDAVECINYARLNGAKVINASWGSAYGSYALRTAISSARKAGIIFVTAAGNEGLDNDLYPSYPANYTLDNIISVAATDRSGALDSNYSNYGLISVDLAAPGTGIYSTWNTSDQMYLSISGTSMASPHVAGAIALLRSAYPNESYLSIIGRLYAATEKIPSLTGLTVTGGRLNIGKLFPAAPVTNEVREIALGSIKLSSSGSVSLALPTSTGNLRLETSTDLKIWTVVEEAELAGRSSIQMPAENAQRYFRLVEPVSPNG